MRVPRPCLMICRTEFRIVSTLLSPWFALYLLMVGNDLTSNRDHFLPLECSLLGSFQPSREMLLRFYALYKQATEGPCQSPRPPFYDVTNRAKWYVELRKNFCLSFFVSARLDREAYAAVHDMAREAAMEEYVGELKKVLLLLFSLCIGSSFLSYRLLKWCLWRPRYRNFLTNLGPFTNWLLRKVVDLVLNRRLIRCDQWL